MAGEQIGRGQLPGEQDMTKSFLLVAGVFLIPVALSYGVDPAATLPKFMNITVENTDQAHIFRALGCLYLVCRLLLEKKKTQTQHDNANTLSSLMESDLS